MKHATILFMILAGFVFLIQPAYAGDHRFGVGAHYWDTVDNIDDYDEWDDVDENGVTWMLSYQYKPSLVGLELDLEFSDEQFGERIYSPQAYLIVGGLVYGGVGIGVHYYDGETSDPFYALKVGLDFRLLPAIHLDINGNYRFIEWDIEGVKDDIDTDMITLGAVVRLEF